MSEFRQCGKRVVLRTNDYLVPTLPLLLPQFHVQYFIVLHLKTQRRLLLRLQHTQFYHLP